MRIHPQAGPFDLYVLEYIDDGLEIGLPSGQRLTVRCASTQGQTFLAIMDEGAGDVALRIIPRAANCVWIGDSGL